jgi:hypothetical protein
MGIYDESANILFHAAMALGSNRVSSVRSAIVDAVKYLTWTDDVKIWRPYHEAFHLYQVFHGHDGDAWPLMRGNHGGMWVPHYFKTEQLMSVLLVYEYLVQNLDAARSPADLGYS